MFRIIAFTFSFLHFTTCDWVSEWMSPIQEQLKDNPSRRTNNEFGASVLDDEHVRMVQVMVEPTEGPQSQLVERYVAPGSARSELTAGGLKVKLVNTLHNAKMLAETLKMQIKHVSARENMLKDAIVNARSGVTSVLVSPMDRAARSYVVRDGVWSLCRGVVRAPDASPSNYERRDEIAAGPRCFGQEVPTQPDPCVFNSVIKYETVPVTKRQEYSEDDFLCLKQSFNNTLERYLSVPRLVINDTCQNGVVRSLEDNNAECGVRVISEYTYYPFHGYGASLPLEYCSEPDGACKLIMAWHVSNATVENFEFLRNEQGFKNYFIKSEGFLERMM